MAQRVKAACFTPRLVLKTHEKVEREEKTDSTELHSELHIHNLARVPTHHTHSTTMTIITTRSKIKAL